MEVTKRGTGTVEQKLSYSQFLFYFFPFLSSFSLFSLSLSLSFSLFGLSVFASDRKSYRTAFSGLARKRNALCDIVAPFFLLRPFVSSSSPSAGSYPFFK